jgi:Leucine-rich repeat (LRR) protein
MPLGLIYLALIWMLMTDDASILASELPDKGGILSLNLANNLIRAEGAKHISAAIKGHEALTILDISGNEIGAYSKGNGGYDSWIASPEGPLAIADAVKDMRVVSSVNLLKNKIGIDQAKALASILKEHSTLKSLCGNKGDETELDMRGKEMDAGDVIMLAAEIVDNGAILSLNLAGNNLGAPLLPAGWTHSPGNGATYRFMHADGSHQEAAPAGTSYPGAIAIANAIKDMGALTSLHVGRNRIPEKEMREIMAIAMRMGSTKILCKIPFKDKSLTELDVSRKNLGFEGALVVAEYLDGNRALTKLDISNNSILSEDRENLQRACMADGIELVS